MTRRILFAVIASGGISAQGKGKGKGKGHGGASSPQYFFSESDRGLITTWVRRQAAANLPPGLAKRGGALPPGLEKQLRKNGRLPPGLDRGSWSPFPPDLVAMLPPLPSGYDRGFIGGQAAIVLRSTQIIVDIFKPV